MSRDWRWSLVAIIMAMGFFVLSSADIAAQSVVRRSHRVHHRQATQALADSAAASTLPDSIPLSGPIGDRQAVVVEESLSVNGDSLVVTPVDTIGVMTAGESYEADSLRRSARNESIIRRLSDIPEDEWVPRAVEFNPDPTRAVWLSALFPGLGQVYNRRYWKLPIVIGGFMGLGYATSWNNRMLNDYTQAYRDLMDNDPSTKSYMDFFPPNAKEEDLNRSWMERTFKARKDFYRRNRDLCIICMVGVYLIAMVDAYVDASLSHFDISPDLTMDVYPTLIPDTRNSRVGIGLQWALNF